MLLGQSIFQSVLSRLKEEEKDDEETSPEATEYRIRGLGAGFITPDGRPEATGADAGTYFDYLADWPAREQDVGIPDTEASTTAEIPQPPPEPPVMPAHLERLTEREIAEDLGLSAKDNEAMLAEKRRQFAKLNHPDRVEPHFRDNATVRMKTANLLIDRAISSLHWR